MAVISILCGAHICQRHIFFFWWFIGKKITELERQFEKSNKLSHDDWRWWGLTSPDHIVKRVNEKTWENLFIWFSSISSLFRNNSIRLKYPDNGYHGNIGLPRKLTQTTNSTNGLCFFFYSSFIRELLTQTFKQQQNKNWLQKKNRSNVVFLL